MRPTPIHPASKTPQRTIGRPDTKSVTRPGPASDSRTPELNRPLKRSGPPTLDLGAFTQALRQMQARHQESRTLTENFPLIQDQLRATMPRPELRPDDSTLRSGDALNEPDARSAISGSGNQGASAAFSATTQFLTGTAAPPPHVMADIISSTRLLRTGKETELEVQLHGHTLSGVTLRLRSLGNGHIAIQATASRQGDFAELELRAITAALSRHGIQVPEAELILRD